MQENQQENFFEQEKFEIGYDAGKTFLWSDVTGLIPLLHSCFERIKAVDRKKRIAKLMSSFAWFEHYKDKASGRRVLSETKVIEYQHELDTAIYLAQANYDVIFAPKALFTREEKKFDIFLIRDTVMLKADLKNITSKNPGTIAKRIKGGSEQASRIVININSGINKKELIMALISGVERNSLLQEVLLFYKGKFYRLPKTLIVSKEIFKILQ